MRDVAFSCDDNGVPFLKVAVWSLLSHFWERGPIRVNVFEGWGGHSAAHKREMAELLERFPFATLRYVNVEKVVEPYRELIENRAGSRWNIFTWTPVFTPLLLPDATGNVIHFDIDMLFNVDISPLFEINLGNNLIACTYEYDQYGDNAGRAIWEKGILPWTVDQYFNTGVLVFNIEACRAERTWEKIIGWYRTHYDIADRIEQDAWNAVYHDRMRPLHVRWNFHDRSIKNFTKWNLTDRLWLGNPPSDCFAASLHPAILHFWGPKKPWKVSHRPYRKLYHAAMRAVGQTVPREPLLWWWHDLKTAHDLDVIRRRFLRLDRMTYADEQTRTAWMQADESRRRRRRTLRNWILTPLEWFAIGCGLVFLVPLPHRVMLALCDGISWLYYACDRRGRALARQNLSLVLGSRSCCEAWRRMILRRSYRNMARSVGHAFWTCLRARARVAAVGEMDGPSRRFLRDNRPAVTVSGHIGCWEILSQLAFLEGHAMMSVAKDIGTPAMTRLLMRARRSIGQEIVPADGAFKALMAGVRGGKSIGLLVDQCVCPLDGGVWVRFLGRPIPVSAAPAFFAAKARVPIVVAWSRPIRGGRYRCECLDEIPAGQARDIWATTQRCARDLERIIRRHPSCWVMNYDFFRYGMRPQDAAALAAREKGGAA